MSDGPLAGVRVVELGGGGACAFAGKWLAGLGAEVVRVEPAGGDPAWREPVGGAGDARIRTPRRTYLDAAKHLVAVDLASAEARMRLAALLETADVVLDGMSGHAGAGRLDASVFADLPRVRVTPFGDGGPSAGTPSTPFTLAARAGLMWHVGDAEGPPLVQWGGSRWSTSRVSTRSGGRWLCSGRAPAVSSRWPPSKWRRRSWGTTRAATRRFPWTCRGSRREPSAAPTRRRTVGRGSPARRGTGRAWRGRRACRRSPTAAAFMAWNERDEATLGPLLRAWFRARTCNEIEEIGRREGVPLSAVRSLPEVAASAQLGHREFFARVPGEGSRAALAPGRLWRSDAHTWLCAPAPAPGKDARREAAPRRPAAPASRAPRGTLLDGVRVLDLGQVWAGPYAAMLLADQGADGIKLESPKRWDPNRCAIPPGPGREREWWNTCAYFQEYDRNKRSLGLDFAHPRGREVLAALVRRVDIVIENYRAGVLGRLGIGYDCLRAQREDVILVSMAAFGQTAPDRARPGYGPVMEQLSGLASLTGWGNGRPQLTTGYAYGDPVAAAAAAAAALAALLQRRRTGRGQHTDLAQFEVLVAMIGEAFVEWSRSGQAPQQQGNGRAGCAPHGAYPCAGNDEWVAIAVETDAEWRCLRRAMADPEWARETSLDTAEVRWLHRAELDQRLAAWTRLHAKGEIARRCLAEGVPAAPMNRTDHELLEDAQLRSRGFYERVAHPAGGEWTMHGWEWRPAGAGPCVRRLAPDFGADNTAILRELAGLSDRQIAALAAEGVIASTPIGVPALPRPSAPHPAKG